MAPNNSNMTTAYCYFHQANLYQSSLQYALSTMVYQLAEKHAEYADHVLDFSTNLSPSSPSFEATLWYELLIRGFSKFNHGTLYLVFDGIDEASETDLKRLTGQLQTTLGRTSNLQILLVGRPETEITIEPLEHYFAGRVHVSSNVSSEDMSRFVHTRYHQYMSRHARIRGECQAITKLLIEKADGMFLWVDLMYQELKTIKSPGDRRRALESVPSGLLGLYDAIFDRIADRTQDAATRNRLQDVFRFVVYSNETLSVHVLNRLIRFRSKDERFDLEQLIAHSCPSLLQLDGSANVDDLLRTLEVNETEKSNGGVDDGDDDDSGDDEADAGRYFDEAQIEEREFQRQSSTLVRIRHASVADYVCGRRTWTGHILPDPEGTSLQLAIACLEVVCAGQKTDEILWRHSFNAAFFKLGEVAAEESDTKNQARIIELLYELFTSASLARFMASLKLQVPFNDPFLNFTTVRDEGKTPSILVEWLRIVSRADLRLSSKVSGWLSDLVSNPHALLRQLVETSINEWLAADETPSALRQRYDFALKCACCAGLLQPAGSISSATLRRLRFGTLPSGVKTWQALSGIVRTGLSVDDLRQIAKTISALRDMQDEARKCYQQAIRDLKARVPLDPAADETELQSLYQECAICLSNWHSCQCDEIVGEICHEYVKFEDPPYFMYVCLGTAIQKTNPEEAIVNFKKALSMEPRDLFIYHCMFSPMRAKKDWNAIVQVVEDHGTSGTSLWCTPLLDTIDNLILYTARKTGKLDVMMERIRNILESPFPDMIELEADPRYRVLRCRDPWRRSKRNFSWLYDRRHFEFSRAVLECHLAILYRQFVKDTNAAYKLFYTAIMEGPSLYLMGEPHTWSKANTVPGFIYQFAEMTLQEIDSSEDPSVNAARLHLLVQLKHRMDNVTEILMRWERGVKGLDTNVLLAKAYHKCGHIQQAQHYLDEQFHFAMGLLLQNMSKYGSRAFTIISKLLHITGRESDSNIAASLAYFELHKPVEDTPVKVSGSVPMARERLRYTSLQRRNVSRSCSSYLDCVTPYNALLDGIVVEYMCMTCPSTMFCESCFQLHVSGTADGGHAYVGNPLEPRCDPEHSFVKIPMDECTLRDGVMTVRGEEISVEDWLKKIRSEWTPNMLS